MSEVAELKPEVKEEPKVEAPELSAKEQLQLKYNQLVAQLGHNISQIKLLERQNESVNSQIEKIVNKVTNIPKDEK